MHRLVPAVALLSQSAAVFGVAAPKPAPAADSAPTVVENALFQVVATGEVKVDEQLNIDTLERTPTTLLKSFRPTPVAPRAGPPTEPLPMPLPDDPFWPPFPFPPTPKNTHDFSPHCHLKMQEECNRIQ